MTMSTETANIKINFQVSSKSSGSIIEQNLSHKNINSSSISLFILNNTIKFKTDFQKFQNANNQELKRSVKRRDSNDLKSTRKKAEVMQHYAN